MSKIAIVTDSNSGITQVQAKEYGIFVIPMPFYIDGELYYEDVTLTQEEFYKKLEGDADISTSQPAVGDVIDLWEKLLKDYDAIIHMPMSSGLSGSCQTASMLAQDYEGKVFVVDNQRISVTQRQAALDARTLADQGMEAVDIAKYLMDTKFDSSIYITLNTLTYLKKGGRITPAAAALGNFLRLKPVLQIQGEKLDAFSKARTMKAAKQTMIRQMQDDFANRFNADERADNMWVQIAYSGVDTTEAEAFKKELLEIWPDHDIVVNPLSLSVSCHIGPGSLAIACSKKLPE